jgi:MFS family permease
MPGGRARSGSAPGSWSPDLPAHPFRPLRHRSVRLIWTAGVVSDIGTWVQLVVVGSLIARDTGSALLTGLTALATFMPQGLAAPVGGLLADRFDRARVFVAGLAGQALFTTVLAVLIASGQRQPLVLTAAILCSSASGSLGAPGYASMLPDLVPPDELMAMVSLGIYSWNAGRVVGPLFGALLNATLGPAWTVAFNAATFAGMALAVLAIRRPFLPPASAPAGIRRRLAEGFQSMRQVRGCRLGVAIMILLNLTVGPFMGLLPIYAHKVFNGGIRLTGVMSSVQGLGAIAGSLTFTALAPTFGPSRLLRILAPGLLMAYALFAVAPAPWTACLATAGLGAGVSSVFVTAMGLAQRDAPAVTRGRVISLAQAGMGIAYGIGILWIGVLADAVGLRWAFGIAAFFATALTLVLIRWAPWWPATVDGVTGSPQNLEVTAAI